MYKYNVYIQTHTYGTIIGTKNGTENKQDNVPAFMMHAYILVGTETLVPLSSLISSWAWQNHGILPNICSRWLLPISESTQAERDLVVISI